MSSKNKQNLLTIFNLMIEENLTPNQCYLLYNIHSGISTVNINVHLEIRTLLNDDWLKEKDGIYLLEPKALSFIGKIDSYLGVQLKKSLNSLMGNDFETNAAAYNDLFPRIKLGSNKPARANIKEIIPAFKWFFETYDYDWKTILDATEMYIEAEKSKNFKYTRTSKYFIRKQEPDKSWSSDLAGYCDLIINGEDFDKPFFSTKVF